MFEKFVEYQGKELPNVLYPVEMKEIIDAEERMQLQFPQQLRLFFVEAGCGVIRMGKRDTEWRRSLVNGILSPSEIASMVCDIDDPTRPQGGIRDGHLPFFDMGWRDYLFVNALSDNPNEVLWQDGTVMLNSIKEFFDCLYEQADFYAGGPGSF